MNCLKASKWITAVCLALGLGMAAFTVWLSLSSRQAEPKLVRTSLDAGQCMQSMLDALCAGDYETAGAQIYGCPALHSGADTESESGRLIWEALINSLDYQWEGEPYASLSGISRDIHMTGLVIDSVTAPLKEASMELLTQRVQEAENVDEIYNADGSYQEDFVMEVLKDAVEQTIQEYSVLDTRDITLTAVYEQGRWWVLPNQALLELISGGIIKQ